MRVLIIDPNPIVAESLRQLFLSRGLEVFTASNTYQVIHGATCENLAVDSVVQILPFSAPDSHLVALAAEYDASLAEVFPNIERVIVCERANGLQQLARQGVSLVELFSQSAAGGGVDGLIDGIVDAVVDATSRRLSYHPQLSERQVTAVGAELVGVNDELLAYLARHPEELRQLHWRKFEEVVAALLERSGFKALLQRGSKDGGVDIIAAQHAQFGDLCLLVQCKQIQKPVGVEVVRELYGVTLRQRASMGILATTSAFTRGARHFQHSLESVLSLRDFDDLKTWLNGVT